MNEEAQSPDESAQSAHGTPQVQVRKPLGTLPAKAATEKDLEQVESEMNAFERSTLHWTKATLLILTVTCLFIGFQWIEMRSGSRDTHDLAVAAGKQADQMKDLADRMRDQADRTKTIADEAKVSADAAKLESENTVKLATAAGIQANATRLLAEQSRRSADSASQSVEDNRIAVYRDLRPYVQITKLDFSGDVFKGEMVKGRASIINSGRTPATNVNGCGDIALKPNGDPMTDEFPCPAPNNPRGRNTGENSRFALGSGASGFTVDSPGTSITPSNASVEVFKQMVSSGAFRIYFYGYIEYADISDTKTVHHTTFCGRYNAVTASLDVCEKHNRMD